ncbi:hypothetical protein GQ44DRAFT_728829 [Phaeosphaeriaceae sp. PMI808]|nr:hypothetical protein GQ44DRAFT_728829 [Phaeosphaeriaceae sp. PMI808]
MDTRRQGGEGRGTLLTMNDFDDSRCYETNETLESQKRRKAAPNYAIGQANDGLGTYPLMRETNVQLPKTATVGEPYSLYWAELILITLGKDGYYTTCIDVDIASAVEVKQEFSLGPQQDAMSVAVAVADWASRTAYFSLVSS